MSSEVDNATVCVVLLSADQDGSTRILKTPVVGELPEWCGSIAPLSSLWGFLHENNVAVWFPGWYLLENVFDTTVYDLHVISPLALSVLSISNATSLRHNRGMKIISCQPYDDEILTASAHDVITIGRHKYTAAWNHTGREVFAVIGKVDYGKPIEHECVSYNQHKYGIEQLKKIGIWVQEWQLGKLKEYCKKHQHIILHGGGVIA